MKLSQNAILPSSIARSVAMVDARRISPTDSNYFALLFDPVTDNIEPVCVVEIFTVGGATPPNAHKHAHEFFYVLAGEGLAHCEGLTRRIAKGDALMLRPGAEHVIENIGPSKLYTLTFMMPNEGFAELIRAGQPVMLDEEDLAILCGADPDHAASGHVFPPAPVDHGPWLFPRAREGEDMVAPSLYDLDRFVAASSTRLQLVLDDQARAAVIHALEGLVLQAALVLNYKLRDEP
jgi:mannose-6-phosphate isomerase-like protein (cupin superfamily)